jgi:sugar/nucleoside kinase (ribokinase family)
MSTSHGTGLTGRGRAKVSLVHPNLHADLLIYPSSDFKFAPNTILPAYRHEVRLGAGGYTGQMLHSLGIGVQYLDYVGDDVFGEFTIAELVRLGHNLEGIVRYRGQTQIAVSVADPQSLGGTMVISFPSTWQQDFDANMRLLDEASNADAYYQWSWYWSYAHPPLAEAPTSALVEVLAAKSGLMMLDPNWKPSGQPPKNELAELRAALPHFDVLKLNLRDASIIVGPRKPTGAIAELLQMGPRSVVLTDGERGCLVASREEGRLYRVSATGDEVRDTTGAGDYFGGALLYALLDERPLVESAIFASAAVGVALGRSSGEPLPSSDAIDARTGEIRTESLGSA